MHVELDILGKNSENILIEEPKKEKTPEAEKPKGFTIFDLPQLEIVDYEGHDIK